MCKLCPLVLVNGYLCDRVPVAKGKPVVFGCVLMPARLRTPLSRRVGIVDSLSVEQQITNTVTANTMTDGSCSTSHPVTFGCAPPKSADSGPMSIGDPAEGQDPR